MRRLWLALLLAACNEGDAATPQLPPEINDCDGLPAISLTAQPLRVRVNEAASLRPAGGSGRYKFEVESAGSGGDVRGDRWVAGATPGTDRVLVRDDCGQQAAVAIEVQASFSVAPARATIKPGTRFTLKVDGMLGNPEFRVQSAGSGGTVDAAGLYTAGNQEGLDLIAVRDGGSGEEVLLQYQVRANAAFRGAPARVGVPAGANITLSTVDGTDAVRWTKLSGPGSLAGAQFSAMAMERGDAVLQAQDTFTGETTELRVQVMEELTRESRAHGRLTDVATLASGDFDGDGMQDLALGVPESDLGRPAGGALFVFRGTTTGLPNTPTWVIEGDSDTGNLGAVLAAGDLDGDGHDDLAVSAPGADVTVADSGSVSLYKFGAEGPRLLRAPLTGLGRGNFGAALAIADVDGDGDGDLLIGSPAADLAPSSSVNSRGVIDIFSLQTGVSIPDLGMRRIGGADLAADGSRANAGGLRFGRGLAVADFNNDGRADLASLGAVNNSLLGGMAVAKAQIAVAVHFGRMGSPTFADTPDLYILPANLADSGEGTWRISVAGGKRILLTADQMDSPDLSAKGGAKSGGNSGGALLFDLSAERAPDTVPDKPKQLGRNDAFARIYGNEGGIAAGRSAITHDVDGDGKLELVLGAPYASYNPMPKDGAQNIRQAGKLLVYPYDTLTAGAELNQPTDFRAGATRSDTLGVALLGMSGSVISLAARASTGQGDYTGRLDVFTGRGALASFAVASAELPAELASQQHGAALKLAALDDQLRVLIGVPGYAGAGVNADGNDVGAGQTLLYTRGSAQVVHEGADKPYTAGDHPAFGGRGTGSDVAFTDFDGDGRKDLVVAAPALATPTMGNTEFANLNPACVTSSAQGNGGALIYIARPDGSFREGFRVVASSAIPDCLPADSNACKRSGLSKAGIAGDFDFDGDGKQDVMLTRSNGMEVFLGRAPDDASFAKPTLVCDPAFSLPALAQGVSAPRALGDIDGDGCAELALRYAQDQRAGLLVAFGFSSGGTRCKAHKQAAWLRISGDGETGLNNMQLGIAAARAGKLLGDARDFVAVSTGAFPFRGVQQPTVLLFDSAQLASERPAMGEALVGALNMGLTPLALVTSQRAVGFGRSLAGENDLDGDGQPDLVVAAPGASVNGDGSGAVFAFRGGPALAAQFSADGSAALDPSVTLVGDGSERASVGQSLSTLGATPRTPPAIGFGAPLSYRSGTANGSAWLYTF